jgi:hypothetical protein
MKMFPHAPATIATEVPAMGNPLLLLAEIRAADSIFNNMGSSLRGRNGLEGPTLVKLGVLLGGLVLAIVFAVYIAIRLRRLWRSTPTWLFLRLCQAHRLPWTERWLLWRVVQHLSLAEPAQLFIEPMCLEEATTLPALFDDAPRLLDLRARLFAGADRLPSDLTLAAPPPAEEPVSSPSGSVAAVDNSPLADYFASTAALPSLDWPSPPPVGGQGAAAP